MIRKGIIVTRDGMRLLGGPGSGNFGHAGIPGQRGGSVAGTGGGTAKKINGSDSDFKSLKRAAENKNGKILTESNNADLKERAVKANKILEYTEDRYKRDYGDPELEQHLIITGHQDSPDGVGYVCYDSSDNSVSIVGCASLDVSKPGTGVRVINYAKKLAKEKDVHQLKLMYTNYSRPYYEKKGWKLNDEEYEATYDL